MKKNKIDYSNKAKDAEVVWGQAYDIMWKVINRKKLKVGIEIGVAFGGHSERILQKTNVKLYSIDPYKHIANYDDPMNLPQAEFDELFKFASGRLKKFGNRSVMLRNTSKQALRQINEELDFVYIDADHSYKGVREDISSWFFKIKDGGVISGHDYGHPNFPGVKKAVDEFFNRFCWDIHAHESGVWWVEKKPLHISFIIPAFNCQDTIGEAVESIYNGNFEKGDEIVIVDDGSTDNTKSVVKKLIEIHKQIKLVEHVQNMGGGAARNSAVMHSKNTLVFCLDSDNVLVKRSVPKLKKFLIEKSANSASFQKIKFFKNTTTSTTHAWDFKQELYDLSDMLSKFQTPGASGNYLYTRNSYESAGGYPEFAGALDAWGFGLRQTASGQSMVIMSNSHYFHRYGHESYWTRHAKKKNSSWLAAKILLPHVAKIRLQYILYIYTIGLFSWFDNLETRPIKIRNT